MNVRGDLTMARRPGSSADWRMGPGTRLVANNQYVGLVGDARLVNEGGTNDVASTMSIGHDRGKIPGVDEHDGGLFVSAVGHALGSVTDSRSEELAGGSRRRTSARLFHPEMDADNLLLKADLFELCRFVRCGV